MRPGASRSQECRLEKYRLDVHIQNADQQDVVDVIVTDHDVTNVRIVLTRNDATRQRVNLQPAWSIQVPGWGNESQERLYKVLQTDHHAMSTSSAPTIASSLVISGTSINLAVATMALSKGSPWNLK